MTLPRSALCAVVATLAAAAFFCWPEPVPLITKTGYPAGRTASDLEANVDAWRSDDPDAVAAIQSTGIWCWLPAGEPVEVMERGPRDLIRVYIFRTRAFLWCNAEAITTALPDET